VRILLTGGAGFIGTVVARELRGRGYDVRVLDSLRPDVHVSDPALDSCVEMVVADVRDSPAVEAALRGVDAVCHLAAKVGLGVDVDDMPDYADSNVHGTAVLLAAMARAGVRTLSLASSMVVYGEGLARCTRHGLVSPRPRLVTQLQQQRWEPTCPRCGGELQPALIGEDAPVAPVNAYAASKAAQEFLADSWARATGGHVCVLRYHNVYGPGLPEHTPYAGVAALFTAALRRGQRPRVYEDGRQLRDFVHVGDVASATVLATERAAATSGNHARVRWYNVGSGIPRTVGEMASALAHTLGGPEPVVTGEYRIGDVRHITADSSRLRTELGWAPRVEFAAGMRELAELLAR
jgi:dTDP-L-rhamnose 4-epimerase